MKPSPTTRAHWIAGVARRTITPPFNVELAGLGYYLNRRPERVRDDLTATALVIGDKREHFIALVAMDLMYNDAKFTATIRKQVGTKTGIPEEAICINFSHSHNAPTAAFARGIGEVDHQYLVFAAKQAVDAVVEAWEMRQPSNLRVGSSELTGISFNRTRENGSVDTKLSVLHADTADGRPLAVVVNFHCHPIAHMEVDLRSVSRDWPGELVDQIEAAMPGVIAMYLQGTCGDVMERAEFRATERRFEVARRMTKVALDACNKSRVVKESTVAAICRQVALPTRRWTPQEVMDFGLEGRRRLATGDTTDWLNGIAKSVVGNPSRLPLRYGGSVEKAVAAVSRFAVEWSEATLPTLNSRPEFLETDVQALRIGDVWFIANEAELFTSIGLEVRQRWPQSDLFMLGYSNGNIGYLPDAHDIERRTYAAVQSPKFTGQFPFTERSGDAMVGHMLNALQELEKAR